VERNGAALYEGGIRGGARLSLPETTDRVRVARAASLALLLVALGIEQGRYDEYAKPETQTKERPCER
jgi:hypothetical protein